MSEDQGPARPFTRLCEGRRGFPVPIEGKGCGAGDVTVCGGDLLRGPRRPQATWPSPSFFPYPARPPRSPAPQRFSTQGCDEGSRPGPRPPTRPLELPSSLFRSTYQTFMVSRPSQLKRRHRPQHLATPWAPLRVPRGHSDSFSPRFVGTCPRLCCYHPFPPRPHPLLWALLGATSFLASLGSKLEP